MKQQVYENLMNMVVEDYAATGTVSYNLITKMRILLERGDKSASVVRELSNMSFTPRDPENLDPYGPQNHEV